MRKLIISLSLLLSLTFGCDWCCRDSKPDNDMCNNDCNEKMKVADYDLFHLTLSLNANMEGKIQTIFVEHPADAVKNDLFAIGGKVVNVNKSDSLYSFGLRDFRMKPLFGKCRKIDSMRFYKSNNDQRVLKVFVSPSPSSVPMGKDTLITLNNFRSTDLLEIDVENTDINYITRRICTNSIAE